MKNQRLTPAGRPAFGCRLLAAHAIVGHSVHQSDLWRAEVLLLLCLAFASVRKKCAGFAEVLVSTSKTQGSTGIAPHYGTAEPNALWYFPQQFLPSLPRTAGTPAATNQPPTASCNRQPACSNFTTFLASDLCRL